MDSLMRRTLFVATVDSHIRHFHMQYLRVLRDMGYEVEVAAGPSGFADDISADGLVVHEIPFSRSPLNGRNWLANQQLTRLMRERQYTMVHVHTPVAGFIGRAAARRAGVPHVT
jgi:hypothetical protein